ncbi:MarR family winged helix-turn-helix transcriptional regulator [Chitinophaga pinensis]|uniref:Transcriptional regulator, MarR family n=1 Tax=Chitinophaga pinensis (strain ATCC 43595 / DSM 2588 / LMG 13176 / NBRC 15968 / NCIMB 11800 / UQM 2034) TaxID=485918 RepID=A0A979GW31_CHIPD|nr:MarR family transcriptional regulator [Chitinophaga pinensis]ACU60260.1 transcriptional regulator, MarR family [Chitinophaga pinensis DSM 2588]
MNRPMMCSTISHLLTQICKVHRNKGNQMLAAHQLHAGQEHFLAQLLCGGPMTMNELTENLEVTPATVTRTAERLEKNGFLTKEKCNNDQRVVRVSLTDKGKEAATDIIDTTWNKLEQQMVKNMSTEEKVLLRRLLMQVLENIEEEE